MSASERRLHRASRSRSPGTEGSVVSYAHCCYPIPGDEIVGFMSSGRGIVIHRDRCRNLAEYRKQPAKWIPVNWTRGVKAEFESEIQVRTLDRVGLLAEVAGRIRPRTPTSSTCASTATVTHPRSHSV